MNMKQLRSLIIFLGLIALAFSLTGCSSPPSSEQKSSDAPKVDVAAKWEGQLVRQPGNSPEDAKVYAVRGGKKRWIVSGDWISKQGYKWPDDVKLIPAKDLDAIPTGDPIQ